MLIKKYMARLKRTTQKKEEGAKIWDFLQEDEHPWEALRTSFLIIKECN